MSKVSIIIAGRNEKYFQQTVDSLLESATGDIEVIAIVDEEDWPSKAGKIQDTWDGVRDDDPYARPGLECDDPRVRIIRLEKAIGQRAAYNLGVRESTGEYVMKIDAHALLSKGFDEKLKTAVEECGRDAVYLPEMRRLDPIKWKAKRGGETLFMYPKLNQFCGYWPQYKDILAKKNGGKLPEYPETMTGQGSCWFCTREWNDHIGLLNEEIGSWGQVGIEISFRTWLQGGKHIAVPQCWQAHLFRKDYGGFPYSLSGRSVSKAKAYVWNNYFFKDDAFEHQCRPFKWLIDKFQPPGWDAYLVDCYQSPRVIVYYTDSQLKPELANAVRRKLCNACGPIPIISVSQEPLELGENVCLGKQPRKYKSVYEAMLAGVKSAPVGSIVYLCEHDVFYHPSHFAFLPPEHGVLYFNENRYYYRDGCDTFDKARGKAALSQGVGYREDWITHAEERLSVAGDDIVESFGAWQNRSVLSTRNFTSKRPNVDILHGDNLTLKGTKKLEYVAGERKGIKNLPGWGRVPHFRKSCGYQNVEVVESGAAAFLEKKFRKMLPQVSPVRVRGITREWLPEMFRACGFKRGAEVGVKRGAFSDLLCRGNPGVEHLCVDIWGEYYEFDSKYGEDNLDACKRLLEPYNVTYANKPSTEAARDVEDGSLDYVYIDADHRFDYVMEDLITWGRKVRPGGVIAGHDYYRFRNAGVVPAVDVYTYQNGVQQWFITDEKEASFFWVK